MKVLVYSIAAKFLISLISISLSFGQTFYHTGNTDYVDVNPIGGILLAGGGGDDNNAMKWFLERADGGDIVVLRASGSDGYNNYLYSQLGVEVNSVTTIVIQSETEADNIEVEEVLMNADAVFIAGGNQWNYVNYWKNTKTIYALEYLINNKGVTIGGTSAGMAVLGEVVFSAENGTVWSSEALDNPYHSRVTLDRDFLDVPFLENTVTDTHYNRPETDGMLRKGRHVAFMARMIEDWDMDARGIAANEYTAVAVDENGTASVFGESHHSDYAYFLKAYGGSPEVCQSGSPLTWNRDSTAVLVYKLKGYEDGRNTFCLADWEDTEDSGNWEFWYVISGELYKEEAVLSITDGYDNVFVEVYPNPASEFLTVSFSSLHDYKSLIILNIDGKVIKENKLDLSKCQISINVSGLSPGLYFIQFVNGNNTVTKRWIKR